MEPRTRPGDVYPGEEGKSTKKRQTRSAAHRLIDFFDERGRDLPWRHTRDPYAIWISEVMLQQTQVRTVLPRYLSFLETFPNVESLAAAHVDRVLAQWSGLGYYRRARQLHAAAREIVARGAFPNTAADILTLPGIGPYTAAAVASIAFDEQVPVLDGNVERVLSRFLALAEDPKRSEVRRILLRQAAQMLTPERPGDGNQALMELGATICRPAQPSCDLCPLRSDCRGWQEPHRYPRPRQRRAVERLEMAIAVVEHVGRLLFFRRSEDAEIMPGLWELPMVESISAGKDLAARLATAYGGVWETGPVIANLRHTITFRDLRLEVRSACWSETIPKAESRFATPAEAKNFATSSIVGKVLGALGRDEG
jgi:A/G-specific adenine glycosylase